MFITLTNVNKRIEVLLEIECETVVDTIESYKLLSLMLSFLLVAVSSFGQTFTLSKPSKKGGFDVESGKDTGKTMTADGLTFKIFKTKTGSKYLKCPSSKGGVYARWIGEPTKLTFKGNRIVSVLNIIIPQILIVCTDKFLLQLIKHSNKLTTISLKQYFI